MRKISINDSLQNYIIWLGSLIHPFDHEELYKYMINPSPEEKFWITHILLQSWYEKSRATKEERSLWLYLYVDSWLASNPYESYYFLWLTSWSLAHIWYHHCSHFYSWDFIVTCGSHCLCGINNLYEKSHYFMWITLVLWLDLYT